MKLPLKASTYLATKQLSTANEVQEKYRRNGKAVDKEVRDVLIKRMHEGIDLTEEQEKSFKGLDDIFGGDEGWKDLESPVTGVEMQLKVTQQKRGKRSIGIGRGRGLADCTAEEACAWYFEYCTNERMAIDKEEGNPARLEIRKREKIANEKYFATIKTLPFPLHQREFLFRAILRKDEEGFSVAILNYDENIDYGGGIGKFVRGTSFGIFSAKNITSEGAVNRCELNHKVRAYSDRPQ